MKKVRNYKIQIFWSLVIALFLLLHTGFVLLILDPKVNVVLSVIFGSVYRKAGETVMTTEGGKSETLAVYKAKNKPFLIVGPCLFHGDKDYEDFFFVNRDQVMRMATDKGGDMWSAPSIGCTLLTICPIARSCALHCGMNCNMKDRPSGMTTRRIRTFIRFGSKMIRSRRL